MICQHCHGTGKHATADEHLALGWLASMPCDECGGTGVLHCCDGLCEQPQEEKRSTGQ